MTEDLIDPAAPHPYVWHPTRQCGTCGYWPENRLHISLDAYLAAQQAAHPERRLRVVREGSTPAVPVAADLYPVAATDTLCPTCKAAPGHRCRSLTTNRTTDTHAVRFTALRMAQHAYRAGVVR